MLKSNYRVIGLMSGTSLDGLDFCDCSMASRDGEWSYQIHHCATLPYNDHWLKRLQYDQQLSAPALLKLNHDYALLQAELLQQFMQQSSLSAVDIDLLANHGHTFYHRPDEGYTYQLGRGAELAIRSGITTVGDFRSQDVALGGQGAPLVPLVDRILFGDYTACLNLGGFINISFEGAEARQAFDICPLNFILNHLSNKLGLAYDKGGMLAAQHEVDTELLQSLDRLSYYQMPAPKSLGAEWVHREVFPLIEGRRDIGQLLATFSEHSARQVSRVLSQNQLDRCLITGGGAFNQYFIGRLRELSPGCEIIKPKAELINFKEALAFALLGVLALRGEVNVLGSVTGAATDHCSGVIFRP